MSNKNPQNDKYVKLGATIVISGVILLVCLFFLQRIGETFIKSLQLLKPVLIGFALAYLLSPICGRMEKWFSKKLSHKLSLGLSVGLSMVIALVVVATVGMLVLPKFVISLINIAQALPGQVESSTATILAFLEDNPRLQSFTYNLSADLYANLESWTRTYLMPALQRILGSLGNRAAGILAGTKDYFFGFLISGYLLAGRRLFSSQLRMLLCSILPKRWADLVEEELRIVDRMFNGFLRGKVLDSAIVGLLCFFFVKIVGMESAALISVIIGVTNIIPIFGPFIGAVPSALLLLLENPTHCLIFIVFVIILQQIDGNFIGPKILGDQMGLNSFWILFSILLFGGLWGLVGMIIGAPLFAVIFDIGRKLVHLGLHRNNRTDLLPCTDCPVPAAKAAAEPAPAAEDKTETENK